MAEWIASIENKKQGKLLTLDDGRQIWISRGLAVECPFTLQEKTELDVDALSEWLLPRQYETALCYAVDLLARQDRATGELRKKLTDRCYLPDTVEMVLYKLEKEHLVNDGEYAKNYALNQMHRKTGSYRIRQELQRKGVAPELIDEALDGLDAEETEAAAVSLAKQLLLRYAKEENPYRKRDKVLAAMARRGYSFDEANEAFQNAGRMLADEEAER